jgi:hypothetical protein
MVWKLPIRCFKTKQAEMEKALNKDNEQASDEKVEASDIYEIAAVFA